VVQASILGLTIILAASVHIRAEVLGLRRQNYIAKPLTMALLWEVALLGQAASPTYKALILDGLVFSMAGDVLLILPSDRSATRLAAFLVAHLCYSALPVLRECARAFRGGNNVALALYSQPVFVWLWRPFPGPRATL
jgi:uncharacterized membrane protein YhhN